MTPLEIYTYFALPLIHFPQLRIYRIRPGLTRHQRQEQPILQ